MQAAPGWTAAHIGKQEAPEPSTPPIHGAVGRQRARGGSQQARVPQLCVRAGQGEGRLTAVQLPARVRQALGLEVDLASRAGWFVEAGISRVNRRRGRGSAAPARASTSRPQPRQQPCLEAPVVALLAQDAGRQLRHQRAAALARGVAVPGRQRQQEHG